MPERRVRTRTWPDPGSGTSTGASSTRRGATKSSRRACMPMSLRSADGRLPGRATVACGARWARELGVRQMGETSSQRLPVREVASAPIPTPYGEFRARAFETPSGHVHLAMVIGEIDDGGSVLTRLHSECLTGDALGSLRCDCGVQLRSALRTVAAEGRGVVLYLNGHEGRGIGLVDKLRAYVEQDAGADTVDANLRLRLDADLRNYDDAAAVLRALGVRSVRLLSNNPAKADGLRRNGVVVESLRSLGTAAHRRNRAYLETKQARLGHRRPAGDALRELPAAPVDVAVLLGAQRPRADRPHVVVKYRSEERRER